MASSHSWTHPAVSSTDVAEAEKLTDKFLEAHPRIKLVAVQWLDICGVQKTRLMPIESLRRLVRAGGAIKDNILALCTPATQDILPDILQHFCDVDSSVVDASTLRALPDAAGLGNLATVIAEPGFKGMAPRTALKRMIARAEAEAGLTYLVGTEIEFCLVQPGTLDPTPAAIADTVGLMLSATTERSAAWPVIGEIVTVLAEAGIPPEQAHTEYGPSQWEVALPPLPPLEAVDAYVFAREVIRNVAAKHGMAATTYPVPHELPEAAKPTTSGAHIHLSAAPVDSRACGDELMAGILTHVPALMAVGMAQEDSYERVGAAKMNTGGYLGWGDENRDMPVRRIADARWEVRIHDGTSNPYAMVAGLIGATLDRRPLTVGGTCVFTAFLSDEQREELGLTQPLPTSLSEALAEVEKDRPWLDSVFGPDYMGWFLKLKRAEMEKLGKMEARERKLLLQKFF